MKKLLLALLLLPVFANGQIWYPLGSSLGSTTFTFSDGDSLTHYLSLGSLIGYPGFPDSSRIIIDTSSSTLWQIGNTVKPIFSNDTIAVRGIMTDTLHTYPRNANNFFILKIGYLAPDVVVDFWHKYQTDSLHAGCIVEFSTDTGGTWMNVADCPLVNTENFYSPTDTIISGQPAFTGNSNGEQLSRVQFINCILGGLRMTSTGCMGGMYSSSYNTNDSTYPIYLRFRFVSDSTIDSLSGWMIDSVKMENAGCMIEGHVSTVSNQPILTIFPSPAYDELNITSSETITSITITNIFGQTVYYKLQTANCQQQTIDVSTLPAGVYFVKIVDPETSGVNGSEVRKFVKG